MSSSGLQKKSWRTGIYETHLDSPQDDARQIKKHRNLYWLHAEMERLSDDVIDREICKRLRQFAGQIEYDLPNDVIRQIKSSQEVDTDSIPEGLLPFYRHYKFMCNRNKKNKA